MGMRDDNSLLAGNCLTDGKTKRGEITVQVGVAGSHWLLQTRAASSRLECDDYDSNNGVFMDYPLAISGKSMFVKT